ncbi:hypothetical protein SDC9_145097 [bioreactor metagenome]|uniref:Uncharacterized protein n=1 Tax=bioreactor metagenome TaxID=1076179 RepID=A0A645E7S3_9ZZZZ
MALRIQSGNRANFPATMKIKQSGHQGGCADIDHQTVVFLTGITRFQSQQVTNGPHFGCITGSIIALENSRLKINLQAHPVLDNLNITAVLPG